MGNSYFRHFKKRDYTLSILLVLLIPTDNLEEILLPKPAPSFTVACVESAYNELIEQFEAGTLKQGDFHHREHLIVTLWYVEQYEELEAIVRIKHGILKYNLIFKVEQSEEQGYHETVTLFFIKLVQNFYRHSDPASSFESRIEQLLSTHPDMKATLREYYSKPRISSPEARRQWVEPDKRSLFSK